ncbi:Retinol dehydrogenase 13 [Mactra antiquata]
MKIPNIPTSLFIASAIPAGFGAAILLKDYIGGAKYTEEHDIIGKTVVITGASGGIGKETALELAKRGGKLLLACRDMNKCERARNEIITDSFNKKVKCCELDLASCESIRNFADKVNKEEKHVDILINNAGVMSCPKQLTKEGFEWQLGVNYLGHFLLTNLLLDKLKQSSQGRVINVVSPLYKKSNINFTDLNSMEYYDPKEAYGQSKLALVLFTLELSRLLEGTNVTVNCVNPGVVKSEIGRHLPLGQSTLSSGFLSPLTWLLMKTPLQGAQTSIYLAVSPEVEKVSGKYFAKYKQEPITENGLDEETARRMWLISEKWTRLAS